MKQESFDCPVAPVVDLLDDAPEITDSVNEIRIPCMADDSDNGHEYQCDKPCIDCPKCGIEADTCLEHMNLDPGGDPECFECEWKRTHGEPSNYKAPSLAFVEREQELYRSAKERLIASGVNQWTSEGAL